MSRLEGLTEVCVRQDYIAGEDACVLRWTHLLTKYAEVHWE